MACEGSALVLIVVIFVVVGGFFQQDAGYEGGGGGQQPLDSPHLDGLKIDEVLWLVDQAHADGSGNAAQADEESDEGRGGKSDPALDLMEMQVLNPGWEGDPAPADSGGGGAELGGAFDEKVGRQEVGRKVGGLVFGRGLMLGGPDPGCAAGVAKARTHQVFGVAAATSIAQSRGDFLGLTGHVHGGWRLPEFLLHIVG